MKNEQYKKYLYTGITAIAVIAASILLFFCLYRFSSIKKTIDLVVRILMPIIYGVVLGYLLSPAYNYFTRTALKVTSKKMKSISKATFVARGISTFISISLTLIVVIGLLYLVVPSVIESIMGIVDTLPRNIVRFSAWLQQLLKDNPNLESNVLDMYNGAATYIETWIKTELVPNLEALITGVSTGLLGVVVLVKNLLIGVIVAIYVLNSKDKFIAQGKKLTYSCLDIHKANAFVSEIRYAHKVFGGFIVGKLLDSLIIGIICFVCMSIINMPYVMLISVIIGVTNIIPFFGPFIGAVPCAIIIILVSPIQCLYFVIFILLLQQFDGNILGPKILGDSTGLSSFWVLFSILLFGGVFGFVGMIIGVPFFAVFYKLVSDLVNRSLQKKKLSTQTDDYFKLDHIVQAENNKYVSKPTE